MVFLCQSFLIAMIKAASTISETNLKLLLYRQSSLNQMSRRMCVVFPSYEIAGPLNFHQ